MEVGTNDRGYRYSKTRYDILSIDGQSVAGYSTLADALEGFADEDTRAECPDWKGSDTDNREFYFYQDCVIVVLEESSFEQKY